MTYYDLDEETTYTCLKCHVGTVSQNIISGDWGCDSCDFMEEQELGEDDESCC